MKFKLFKVLHFNTFFLLVTFAFAHLIKTTDGACMTVDGQHQDCRKHDGLCTTDSECPFGTKCSHVGFCGGNKENGDGGNRMMMPDIDDTAYEEPSPQEYEQEEEEHMDEEPVDYTEPEPEAEPEPEPEPEYPELEPVPKLKPRPKPAHKPAHKPDHKPAHKPVHKPKKLFKPWGDSSYLNPAFAQKIQSLPVL